MQNFDYSLTLFKTDDGRNRLRLYLKKTHVSFYYSLPQNFSRKHLELAERRLVTAAMNDSVPYQDNFDEP